MTSLLLSACAALGVYFLLTHSTTGQQLGDSDRPSQHRSLNQRLHGLLLQAGLDGVSPIQFLSASAIVGLVAMIPAAAIFGF